MKIKFNQGEPSSVVFPIPMLMEQFIKFHPDESDPFGSYLQGHTQFSPPDVDLLQTSFVISLSCKKVLIVHVTDDEEGEKNMHGDTIKLIPKLKDN